MPKADPVAKTPPDNLMPDGMITDCITGQPVKDTEKERVRQEVARQLIFEYQIAPESMEADFAVKVEGKRKKVDIAIFEAGKDTPLGNHSPGSHLPATAKSRQEIRRQDSRLRTGRERPR